MADLLFGDWDEMARKAQEVVDKILKDKVAPAAEEIMKDRIQKDVYDAYSPKVGRWINGTTYRRRGDLIKNVYSKFEFPGSLFVTSSAKAGKSVVKGYSFRDRYEGSFLKMIEGENHGIWAGGFPRPVVTNTEEIFRTGGRIIPVIRNSIGESIGSCDGNPD